MVKRNKEVEIDSTIENIKIIERQIEYFEGKRYFCFQKKKIQENKDRINNLVCVKKYLYKRLEHQIDKN